MFLYLSDAKNIPRDSLMAVTGINITLPLTFS